LLLSRSVYPNPGPTITIGQPLPGGGNAVADGGYPQVFQNAAQDPSFGVTSPISIDRYTLTGTTLSSPTTMSLQPGQLVTSFSSKSEVALNPSTDGKSVTFMGYAAGVSQLDVSNSNTPGHVDPTNPVTITPVQRGVAQIDATGQSNTVQVTNVNAYSGNNGRAAILDSTGGQYFLAGNAGNGACKAGTNAALQSIVGNTGVQIATPGGNPETTVLGTQQGTPTSCTGWQYGFSVVSQGYPADKSGKDDNFRGATIFDNTLYVSKGSGGNGINTVYRVGNPGSLPTTSSAITILQGFPTVLASATPSKCGAGDPVSYPFGLWFANSSTLYVADEGNGCLTTTAGFKAGGLQKWVLNGSTWSLAYTLTSGLDLGGSYTVGSYPAVATDGLRSLTGRNNGDGTVTLFSVTSTVSASGDQGADPNKLVAITDTIGSQSPGGESFTTLRTAAFGEVLRGVAFIALPTTLTYTGPTLFANGAPATLTAVLKQKDAGNTPVSGRSVTLTLGSQSCTGTTNASGTASCTIPNLAQTLGPEPITATFAGDSVYQPSSTTASAIVFAYTTGGSFVVGDRSDSGSVTFWGAQWAKANSLSGGAAPNSFKGFADGGTPACGSGWSASPGGSGNPPASIGSYIAVIASSSISKSGPNISGDTSKIVIVKTDAGYAADPSHPGTGTVVATLCS
jgi:hypothetical protein